MAVIPAVSDSHAVARAVNTGIVGFFDLGAVLPPHPLGLVLVDGHDHRLLRIAAATAQLFAV